MANKEVEVCQCKCQQALTEKFELILNDSLSRERRLWEVKTDDFHKELIHLSKEIEVLKVAIWGEEVLSQNPNYSSDESENCNVQIDDNHFRIENNQQVLPHETLLPLQQPQTSAYKDFLKKDKMADLESAACGAKPTPSGAAVLPSAPPSPEVQQTSGAQRDPHLKTGGEQRVAKEKVRAAALAEEVAVIFKQLKVRRKYRYAIFKIQEDTIIVEKTGPPDAKWQDFAGLLPYTDCRFAIYDHPYKTSDGRQTSKLLFICWFPTNSNSHKKMAYTDGKALLKEHLQGVLDVNGRSIEELEVAIGIREEDDEDSDIDFDS